jgi:hypothetical protein
MNKMKVQLLDTVKLQTNSNEFSFESHFNFDKIMEIKNGLSIYFDKKTGELNSIKTDKNGKLTEYHFNNSKLYYNIVYYIGSDEIQTSPEICVFNNMIPDIRNSVFLDVKKLDETQETIQIEVNYNSGYDFLNGTIYYGKKMFTLKDSVGSLSYKMTKVSQKIRIPKSKIDKKEKVLNVFIERSLKREIPLIESYPAKGCKSIYGLYIKEFDL